MPAPGPEPVPEPEPVAKFAGTWTERYDSPLSPRQYAYCQSASLRAGLKTLDDWVVLVNEVPKSTKGKTIGVLETPCSVLKAEFPSSVLSEKLRVGNALYINGKIKDETVQVTSFVRTDRRP